MGNTLNGIWGQMDKSETPKFSIIMVDYDGSVNRDYMRRAVRCLMVQTYQNFEVILLHDGPKKCGDYKQELSEQELGFIDQVVIGTERKNDWGHSMRDHGMRIANGEYIVHFNADNLLYPHALERLTDYSEQDFPAVYDDAGQIKNDNSVLIFSIYMKGVLFCNGNYSRRIGEEDTYATIMTGIPTKFRNIDCMQLVMKRDIWLAEGGWYDQSRNSDGIMYPKFALKYGTRYLPEILGEHW